MRTWTLGAVAAVAVMTAAVTPAGAADTTKDLIVGKWEATPDDASVALDFAKDGKLKFTVTKGANATTYGGTYSFVDDQTIEVTMERDGQKITQTLTVKVSKGELTTTDDKKKKTTFKRAK